MNEWQAKRVRGQATWIGLYGNGMHDFILRECEVGFRVAAVEDDEACGFGPVFDLQYQEYVEATRD
jgi:hypothetical protein